MAARGKFSAPFRPVIGRISETREIDTPSDTILVCRDGQLPEGNLSAFAAVLIEGEGATGLRTGTYESLAHLHPGDIVLVDGLSGRICTLFRQGSPHNALFLTEHCNSNCLMCSQPPKEDDGMLGACLRIVELLKNDPPTRLGITGGEPTLLGDGFIRLLEKLRDDLPDTVITALTNGRTFADPRLANQVGAVAHPHLRFSIPLHGDVPEVHDYIVQVRGAFVETLAGFYNLEASNVATEIRIVLHAQSVPRLHQLVEFIWRKLPFVAQVAFMGLEQMGYVKKNWDVLWIDPIDYADDLRNTTEYLFRCGLDVSVYNLPLCIIPKSVWGFSRQSISDHKQTLLEKCVGCDVKEHCAGFFTSGTERLSRAIFPVLVACHDHHWPRTALPLGKT